MYDVIMASLFAVLNVSYYSSSTFRDLGEILPLNCKFIRCSTSTWQNSNL